MLKAGVDLTFPPDYANIAGNFVAVAKAKISLLNWGLLRSDAVYDVAMHSWAGSFA